MNTYTEVKNIMIDRNKNKTALEKTIDKAEEFSKGYKTFLNEAKTEREAVNYSLELIRKAGFEEFDPEKKYKAYDRVFVNNRGKALILAVIGKNGLKDGALITAAHVDAPRLDLKPNPLYQSDELAFFKTHYYGGIKKYQWTAIPLALHGVVIKKDMSKIDVKIGEDDSDPKFCITDLLPHLGATQMEKKLKEAILGEQLNILIGSIPLSPSEQKDDLVKANIMKILYNKYGLIEEDFLSAELTVVPAFKACDLGLDRSMIGSYGQDDKVCAYAALTATMDCTKPERTSITVLTDKEEIGSTGNTGLKCTYLFDFISDLADMEKLKIRHVLAKSMCLSTDVNAGFDPNYSSVFEQNNSCFLNEGVVLTKYTGSGGKSGTSDASAEFIAVIRNLFEKSRVLFQSAELGKVDAGGGGTVSQFIANLNVDVLDVGVPLLSMHSPFEVTSKLDTFMLHRAIYSFFNMKR